MLWGSLDPIGKPCLGVTTINSSWSLNQGPAPTIQYINEEIFEMNLVQALSDYNCERANLEPWKNNKLLKLLSFYRTKFGIFYYTAVANWHRQYTVVYKAFLHSFSYNSYNSETVYKGIRSFSLWDKLELWELALWNYKYQGLKTKKKGKKERRKERERKKQRKRNIRDLALNPMSDTY
jgi:hypothetical protein